MPEDYKIDQTLHGYDKGHRLLAASMRISPQDDRALLTMSDLSGSRVVEGFFEYITGYMLPSGGHFALGKTWYATEMKRPGCVWTHTLLIPSQMLPDLRSAEALLSLFVRPRLDLEFRYADKLDLPLLSLEDISTGNWHPSPSQRCAVEELYRFEDGSVGVEAQSGAECELFVLRLWSQMWPKLREQASFCSGSLSLRVLSGKPLDLQCGPERIARELKTERDSRCPGEKWAQIVSEDLAHPGRFRDFLRLSAGSLASRSSMMFLAQIYALLVDDDHLAAIEKIAKRLPSSFEALELKKAALSNTSVWSSDRQDTARLLTAFSFGAFNGVPSELKKVLAEVLALNQRDFILAFESLSSTTEENLKSIIIDILAMHLGQHDFEWLSEARPKVFDDILQQHPAIAYQSLFWTWNFSLFEKVDLFRALAKLPEIKAGKLFEAVFASGESELLSRLVGQLSDHEVPLVLEWIQRHDGASTSPEWTTFLKGHRPEFIAWLNNQSTPDLSTVILAANVLDAPPALHTVLSTETVLRLASGVKTLPRDRHEVAAFIFVTTAWVKQEEAAAVCLNAFVELHRAIAQSRLSNRAWEILSPMLVPLHDEQWDSCEKLRRATLYFLSGNQWNFRLLWGVIRHDIDLFYDFTRTARSYAEGKQFFESVYDASERGEFGLEKKQSKELRKLLSKGWW